MFINEAPSVDDAALHAPLADKAGSIIRTAMHTLGIKDYYLTNAVICRSCRHKDDRQGQPIYRRDRKTGETYPVIEDRPPAPDELVACSPRLYEEIYLVDPILIVPIGNAIEFLAKQAVKAQDKGGHTLTISIPGAGHKAKLTEKSEWVRRNKNTYRLPTVPNTVDYLTLPLIRPSWVLSRAHDKREDRPIKLMTDSLRLMATIYDRYQFEVHGDRPPERVLSEEDLKEEDNG